MKMRWLVCCLLLAVRCPAFAQSWLANPAALGTIVASVGSAQVRLPPGDWEIVGDQDYGGVNNSNAGKTKLFLQVDNGVIAALVRINANLRPPSGRGAHWLVPSDCGRSGEGVQYVEDRDVDQYNGVFDCMLVGRTKMSTNPSNDLWKPLADRATSLGGIPRVMSYVTYHRTSPSRLNLVTVTVFINPDSASVQQLLGDALGGQGRSPSVDAAKSADLLATWARGYRATVAASWP